MCNRMHSITNFPFTEGDFAKTKSYWSNSRKVSLVVQLKSVMELAGFLQIALQTIVSVVSISMEPAEFVSGLGRFA